MLTSLDLNSATLGPSGWNVRVDCQGDIPQQFNCQDIRRLFQGQVSTVGVSEHLENGRKWIRVTLGGEDELKKALCMSGYTIGETRIQVRSLSGRQLHAFPNPKLKGSLKARRDVDTRRNLYVLNLPHDLSAQAYRDLFTSHGMPTHSVLLKTHDSCSRRRGFVVMSTHEEAQNVIHWLDGICIRGFQLRVTWANIDRSDGFMSGYDRTTYLGQSCNPSPDFAGPVSHSSCEPKSQIVGMDTNIVVASNIPVSLFPGHESDSLFKPFGIIKDFRLISPNPTSENSLSTLAPASPLAQTAVVTYEKARDAISAKNTLHGQVYAGFSLSVGFVSKLGNENRDDCDSSSVPPTFTANISPPFTNYVPSSAFFSTRFPTPNLPFEENFRGLPSSADMHEVPLQLQYANGTYIRQFYDNWTGYHSSVPQALTHHGHETFHMPSQYGPDPADLIHDRYRQDSRFIHYPDSFATGQT